MVAEGTKFGTGLYLEASSSTADPEAFAILFRWESMSGSYQTVSFMECDSVSVWLQVLMGQKERSFERVGRGSMRLLHTGFRT